MSMPVRSNWSATGRFRALQRSAGPSSSAWRTRRTSAPRSASKGAFTQIGVVEEDDTGEWGRAGHFGVSRVSVTQAISLRFPTWQLRLVFTSPTAPKHYASPPRRVIHGALSVRARPSAPLTRPVVHSATRARSDRHQTRQGLRRSHPRPVSMLPARRWRCGRWSAPGVDVRSCPGPDDIELGLLAYGFLGDALAALIELRKALFSEFITRRFTTSGSRDRRPSRRRLAPPTDRFGSLAIQADWKAAGRRGLTTPLPGRTCFSSESDDRSAGSLGRVTSPRVVSLLPPPFLHVTAPGRPFNWLFARNTGGTFVLRVEDTNAEKTTQEFVDAITQPLRWLGLDWDEGPYFQSERLDQHLAAIEQLLDSGHAYCCDLSAEEVEALNEEAGHKGGYHGWSIATSRMGPVSSCASGLPTMASLSSTTSFGVESRSPTRRSRIS